MQKNAILAGAAVMLLAATSAGHAADIPGAYHPYAAPVPYSAYSWAGPYLGANVGYISGDITNNPTQPSGGEIGAQLGYNWQNGSLVFGAETDMQLTNADDVIAPWKFSNPWFGTTRARVGYALNNVLFYGTGGLAYGDLDLDSNGLTQDKTHLGWTVGLGAEMGLTPNWTAKVEYLYVDLADRTYFIGTSNGFEANLFRLGVNYRF